MDPIPRCPKCGLELADSTVKLCPMCCASIPHSRITAAPRNRIWLGLFQFALSSIFMLVFGFPKIMIAVFGIFILIGTLVLLSVKSAPNSASPPAQQPVSNPARFQILTLAVALCFFVCFGFLLFGGVIFANNWNNFQRYKDASYHRADFLVTRVYYQRRGKTSDVYASGTVEGQREWMSLMPYLQTPVRSQGELEMRVPAGTSIPIYLFPDMKGRSRVRVYQEIPTAESYHQAAINALRWGLGGLAICGGILFLLLRLRSACFAKSETTFYATAQPW